MGQDEGPCCINPGNIHIMGNEDECHMALLLKSAKIRHHMTLFLFILPVGDFIKDQGLRLKRKGRRNAKAAFLTKGKGPRVTVQKRRQSHGLYGIPHLTVNGGSRKLLIGEPIGHFFIDRIPQDLQVWILEYVANLVGQVCRFKIDNIPAIDEDLPAAG